MSWLTDPAPVPFWAIVVFILAYGACCIWAGHELGVERAARAVEAAELEDDLDQAEGKPRDLDLEAEIAELAKLGRDDEGPIDGRGGDAGDAAPVHERAAAASFTRPAAAALGGGTCSICLDTYQDLGAHMRARHQPPAFVPHAKLADWGGDFPGNPAGYPAAENPYQAEPEAEPMRPGRQTLIAAGLDRMSTIIFQSDEVTVARYAGPDMGPDYPRGRIQVSLTGRVDGGLPRHFGLTYTQWALLVEAATAIGAVPAEAEEVSD